MEYWNAYNLLSGHGRSSVMQATHVSVGEGGCDLPRGSGAGVKQAVADVESAHMLTQGRLDEEDVLMYEPEHTFEYALKMINPLRLSDYRNVNVRGTKYCSSLQELRDFISVSLPPFVSPPDFDMGYIESGHGAKGRKVWLFDNDDLSQMCKYHQKKKKILLWCYTEEIKKTVQKQPTSKKDKMSGRASNYESQLKRSEQVEEICQQLKEKHGNKYKPEQLRTWAHMVHVGTHDSLQEPPDKPFFRGVGQKRPREPSNSTSPERKKAVPVSLSPGRRVNIRSELIDQLKKCQDLVESGAISQDVFQELQGTILKDIKLL